MIATTEPSRRGPGPQARRGWKREQTEDAFGFRDEARGRTQVAPEVGESRLAREGTNPTPDQMSDQPFSSAGPELSGENLRKISSAIVGLYREHFGKGPTGAKTYVLDDLVICVLRDGLTTVEKTLFERGKGDVVREMRAAFQDAVARGSQKSPDHLHPASFVTDNRRKWPPRVAPPFATCRTR